MKTLTVRNVPDEVYTRLRVRAATKGLSLEAQIREILQQSASAQPVTRGVADAEPFALIREQIRKANGGKLPKGRTAAFLKERRAMWGED